MVAQMVEKFSASLERGESSLSCPPLDPFQSSDTLPESCNSLGTEGVYRCEETVQNESVRS